MNISIARSPSPLDWDQGNAHLVSHSVSCPRDIHGYYACLFRGDDIVWETTKAFNGHARELFTLEWDLSSVQPGDQFKVYGFVRDEDDQPVQVGSCIGLATELTQNQTLTLS
jgi:hypothetical protein